MNGAWHHPLVFGPKAHLFAPTSFRQIPVFGETTIRRFEGDVSEMKKLAAHDFEDLLQASAHLSHRL